MSLAAASTDLIEAEAVPAGKVEPLRAWRALQRLREDPSDIAQGFVIVDSLAGQAPLRVLERFRRSATGRQLLRERPALLSRLRDRRTLERMPRNSLAHVYLAFLDRGGVSADGLVQASVEGRGSAKGSTSEFLFVRDRIRDSHDLWHAVTGYPADVPGELALLSFNVAQLRNPGIAALVLGALTRYRQRAIVRAIGSAFVHGLRASWLPPAPWEALLPLPLDEVRLQLGVRPAQ